MFNNKKFNSTIQLELTTRCNFNCPHCLRRFLDGNKTIIKDMPVSLFEEILIKGKKMNFTHISFTGGECILHPEFKKIIELVGKYNYKFMIINNGWFYEEYFSIFEKFLKNLDGIGFSLDGATAEVHDKVRNKPGSFNRVIEAIKFYRERNIKVLVNACFNKINYHQIQEIIKICLKLGVASLKCGAVMPMDNSYQFGLSKKEKQELLETISNLPKATKNTIKVFPTAYMYQNTDGFNRNFNFCSVLDANSIFIDYDGGFPVCCDIYNDCINKPTIRDYGFEKALGMSLESIVELKKKRIKDLLNGSLEMSYNCDYCNKYLNDCFKLVNKKNN